MTTSTAGFSMQLKGLNSLQAQLSEFGAIAAAKALSRAARRAFLPVLEAAVSMAPIDTGDLRASIRITVVKPKSGDAAVVVGLRFAKVPLVPGKLPPARRWHFIEFGTAFIAAHPFLRPALDQNAKKVTDLLQAELNKEIGRLRSKR